MKITLVMGLMLLTFAASAQYMLDWWTVGGGGGASTGGVYAVSGTVGQHDAGTAAGGAYAVTGGFWGVSIVVQTPGAPSLSLAPTITNTLVLSWSYSSTAFVLEQSSALESANWTAVTTPPVQVGSRWQVVVTPAKGNQFYRLRAFP